MDHVDSPLEAAAQRAQQINTILDGVRQQAKKPVTAELEAQLRDQLIPAYLDALKAWEDAALEKGRAAQKLQAKLATEIKALPEDAEYVARTAAFDELKRSNPAVQAAISAFQQEVMPLMAQAMTGNREAVEALEAAEAKHLGVFPEYVAAKEAQAALAKAAQPLLDAAQSELEPYVHAMRDAESAAVRAGEAIMHAAGIGTEGPQLSE